MRHLLCLSLMLLSFLLSSGAARAQSICTWELASKFPPGCSTKYHTNTYVGPYHLRIYVHVIRRSNSTGGQSVAEVKEALSYLDRAFSPHNIFFVWDCEIDYLDDDDLFEDEQNLHLAFSENPHADGIDIYLFPDSQSMPYTGNGVADFGISALAVGGNFGTSPYNSRVRSFVLAHEMGHCLGLLHTHHITDGNISSSPMTAQELVTRDPGEGANCEIAGDCICDTPADNEIGEEVPYPDCEWSGPDLLFDKDANMDYYAPDVYNIMSYSHDLCYRYLSAGQGKRMRNVIELEPELQACLVGHSNITSNTTWNLSSHPSGEIHIAGNLVVESGYTLTIASGVTVLFSNRCKLIIEPNAHLILEGTLSSCNTHWQGVEIWGTSSASQYAVSSYLAQGRLTGLPGAIIENAETGARTWGPYKLGNAGGMIHCTGVSFLNNKVGVDFASYYNFWPFVVPSGQLNKPRDYAGTFIDCLFSNSMDYPHEGPSVFVQMNGVKGITFLGCEFSNNDVPAAAANFSDYGVGIRAVNARFSVSPMCLGVSLPCTTYQYNIFRNLGYGIQVGSAYNLPEPYIIREANFLNCYVGHENKGVAGGTIVGNHFYMGGVPDPSLTDVQIGLKLGHAIDGITVQENTFEESKASGALVTIGIQAYNLGEFSNVIRRNSFSELDINNQAGGKNASALNPGRGLYYDCNFSEDSHEFDFLICESGNVREIQGLRINPDEEPLASGNSFAFTGATSDRDFSNQGNGDVDFYYYDLDSDQTPVDYSAINPTVADLNLCSIEYCLPPCKTQNQLAGLKGEYQDQRLLYNTAMADYEAAMTLSQFSVAKTKLSLAAYHRQLMDERASLIVLHIQYDTINPDPDSLFLWRNRLGTYSAALHAIPQGFVLYNMYDTIPICHDLDSLLTKDVQNVEEIDDMLDGVDWQNLDAGDKSALEGIAAEQLPVSSGRAETILQYYGHHFPPETCEYLSFRSKASSKKEAPKTNPITVSPNPANEKVSFRMPEDTRLSLLEVYDLTGRLIWSVLPEERNHVDWDCSKSAQGLYFYRALSSENSFSSSFVIQR